MKNNIKLPLYSLLLIFFISLTIVAQENSIYELKGTNVLSKENSSSNKSFKNENNSNREDFYDLAFKLHSTTYIANNVAKKNSQNSNSISKLTFEDTKSFNLLKENNSDLNTVELISITLIDEKDLNNKLDLSDIRNLSHLKYVFIKCSFKCTEKQIKEFINTDSNVRVFYKIEIPS